MPDNKPQAATNAEAASGQQVRDSLMNMAQDLKLILEEMRIAEVDIKTSAAADTDCCCCCTPASSCCGAASVKVPVPA